MSNAIDAAKAPNAARDLINHAATTGNLNGGDDEEPINDSFRNSGILSLLGQLQANLAGLESGISDLDVQVGSIAAAVQDERFDSPGVESRKSEVAAVIATIPAAPAN